jgi:hypothetical protein
MGQTCNEPEKFSKNETNFMPMRQSLPGIELSEEESRLPISQSRLLMKMSSVRLKGHISSEFVKSRLTHLPEISTRARNLSE